MYTTEQIKQMVEVKRAEVQVLVAQGIITQEQVEPAIALYAAQLQGQVQATPVEPVQVEVPVQPVVEVQVQGGTPVQPVVEGGNTDKAVNKILGAFTKKDAKQMRFEYQEITDLYLPKLNDADKAKAVRLANDIELLRASIYERTEEGIIVPDAEMDSLNNMIKAFKKLTRTDYFKAVTSVAKKGGTKVVELTSTVIEEMDARTAQLITDLEDVICGAIEGVEGLATLTLGFASNLTQGAVKLGGSTTKGVLKAGFNLFKSRK